MVKSWHERAFTVHHYMFKDAMRSELMRLCDCDTC